ncbi:expressed unknown protein [Seminavis robusta]|uniref:DDRGK domain-containing protein 1 n=1 Tax=Seminavis robusta TaxID=568900 RepID=A0A9N8HEX3_9STRA|nr:expressed unknown protein [Seminavis robusta]|eukprot:Sro323_g117220.1 n/a (299) ;mRNA; f:6037-6933
MSGDDPFDNYDHETEVTVGFSDGTLLAISVFGFAVMAFVVFSIIISRVKSADELEKGEADTDLNYEEELLRADVASLNRAQRRARAKALMKRERRVVGDEQQLPQHDDEHHNEDDSNEPHLSRKDRQKAAKVAERKERHVNEEQRREEQKQAMLVAKEEKKKRLELEAERAKEQKIRREEELEQKKKEEFDNWNTFLVSRDRTVSLSVHDWVQELQFQNAVVVPLRNITRRFDCSMEQVKERICQLVDEGRINGVVDGEMFYVLSHRHLLSLASFVAANREVSLRDVSHETKRILETA